MHMKDDFMKFETEITVEVNTSLDNLDCLLKNNNFKIKEEYDVNDIYLIDKSFSEKRNYLEMLNHCILIRDIIEKNKKTKLITYKYKEYNEKNEIIKQGKINCEVSSITDAKKLLEALGYEEIISINDHLIVYENNDDELCVQLVNNKHIYIEIEDRKYRNIDEMKNVIKKYNIPIKNNDYFVKKAEIEMKESL